MKLIFIFTFFTLCLAAPVNAQYFETNIQQPNSSLGDMFLNKCFMEWPPGILTTMGEVITHRYINPRSVAAAIIAMILVLPFLFFNTNNVPVDGTVGLYLRGKFALLHFLHRINYSVLLIVGLYCVFRQGRPCEFNGQKIGGYYGMPSGDAMGGGIIAAFIFGRHPTVFRSIVAFLVVVLVDVARVACGFHSIGMVIAGTAIGMALHYYSIFTPLYHIWIDTFVSSVGVALVLAFDPSLVFGFNNTNNLWAWLVYGIGNQLFICLMFVRFMKDQKLLWRKASYVKVMDWLSDPSTATAIHINRGEDENLVDTEKGAPRFSRNGLDFAYTYLVFGACIVVQFIAVLVQVFDWIGIPGPAQNGGGPSPL